MVELQRVSAHLQFELGLLVKDWLELGMADAERIDMHQGLVGVLSFLVE